MKKIFFSLLFIAGLQAANAQNSGTPVSLEGTWAANMFPNGNWSQNYGSVTIQFTKGDILFFGINGKQYANGIYQYSGNVLSGSFNVTSNGTPTKYSFKGSYDVAKGKLVFTSGSADAVTGQAGYLATKKTAPTTTTKNEPLAPEGQRFYLRKAFVTLGSGNDNKDKGAKLYVELNPRKRDGPRAFGYILLDYTDELKKFEWWTKELPRGSLYNESSNMLGVYQEGGLSLTITYKSLGGPFPLTDAWKLDHVKLNLEFYDNAGNLKKINIEFPNSSLRFTGSSCLKLETDGNFKPLAPSSGTYCPYYE